MAFDQVGEVFDQLRLSERIDAVIEVFAHPPNGARIRLHGLGSQSLEGEVVQVQLIVAGKARGGDCGQVFRSEEHTSELQSLMRISYAVFCLKKKQQQQK